MPTPAIRVLILGGGFAGLATYLGLHRRLHGNHKIAITLVNNRDAFEFLPMLHEVATGGLLPSSIRLPLRGIPQCCLEQFIEGTVQRIDLDTRAVALHVPSLDATQILTYDHLVVALGSTVHYFDTPGAAEHTYTLKSLHDARRLKTRIITQFERATHCTTDAAREHALRFVIVGGGPTGVELAAELSDLIRHELARAFPNLIPHTRILLLQSGDHLVPQVDAWFDRKSRTILERTGLVDVRLRTRVQAVHADGVLVNDVKIPAATVIWTAGVRAQHVDLRATRPVEREERSERWKVSATLQLPEYPETFVVGDQAWVFDHGAHQPYPMRAQFAIREGAVASANIVRIMSHLPPHAFHWRDMGFLLSLGKGGALGETFGIRWSGPLAWWLYRTAYLTKIIGIRAKLRTALEWTVNLFSPRDLSKL